jgi:hypothetical protein
MRRLPAPLRERVGGAAFFSEMRWSGFCGGGGRKHALPSLVLGGEDTAKEVH